MPFGPKGAFIPFVLAAERNSLPTIVPDNASSVYDRVILNEDVTWRGSILVKGFVVVAPQATLRIEPGTVVRFSGPDFNQGLARLVIQGRIQALGTAVNPIIMTSGSAKTAQGGWGGVAFVSSGKRNMLEYCRIEYADSGIDASFSSVNMKMISITKAHTAILAHDAVVHISGGTIAESETGIEAHDSEFDVRDATITNCRRGFTINRSSVGIVSTIISGNEQYGLLSTDCRISISSGEFSNNGKGAIFNSGEGQIQTTKFVRNRETALHLAGSRMKIHRCQFAENSHDAIRLEDSRALVSGNVFDANRGFNIYHAGGENTNAILNWWGSADHSVITGKIHDATTALGSGNVKIFPWLTEKPHLLP